MHGRYDVTAPARANPVGGGGFQIQGGVYPVELRFRRGLGLAGADIRTVAQLSGHATIQMTMRYAHLAAEREQMAVDRFVSWNEVVAESAKGHSRRRVSRKPHKVN